MINFENDRSKLAHRLLGVDPINRSSWQGLEVGNSPAHSTRELHGVYLDWLCPPGVEELRGLIKPDLPWAEDHFLERVGGKPINPGRAEAYWPYHGALGNQLHKEGKIYSHNYMERMWASQLKGFRGYRYSVGDLGSVVALLKSDHTTRRGYLPIWFPEDTGSSSGQRVPCSLGYYFIQEAPGQLSCHYHMRACEMYRHFTNDVYLAARLLQWVSRQVDLKPSQLYMAVDNLHSFLGDDPKIRGMLR